jgi:hypothetical protein
VSSGSRAASVTVGWRAWAAAGAAVFALALAFSAASGFGMADEAWYLRVIYRVLAGEVLYRDVFLGVTPLSVYVVAPLAALFGTEVLVVKAVVALCFTASVLTGCGICRQLGLGWRPTLTFGASLFVYLLPGATLLGSPYSVLAQALLLGCFACALRWLHDARAPAGGPGAGRGMLAAAGTAAGLCFMAKQNIGVFALAALMATVVVASRGARPRAVLGRLALIAGVFAGVVALVAAPVAASGGLEALVDYGFTGKGAYVRAGRISYWDGVAELVSVLGALPDRLSMRFLWQHQFALPFVVFPVMLAAWSGAEPERRIECAAVLLFVAAGFLGVFPRATASHLALGNPLLLLGLVHGWDQLRARAPAPRLVEAAAVAWVGILLAGTAYVPVRLLASGRLELSRLPHFRGVVVDPGLSRRALSTARQLSGSTSDREIFLITPHAGFYYLLTGLDNPTPYDYPMVTAFGSRGEARVEAMLRGGRIRAACVDPAIPPVLHPARVVNAVRGQLRFSHPTRLCSVYAAPDAARPPRRARDHVRRPGRAGAECVARAACHQAVAGGHPVP